MRDRRISLEKISNIRDLGGLRTADGRFLAPGLLLRSANLAEATLEDRKVLREKYHLAKIIDLRTGTERREKPDATIPEVDYVPIPIFDESVAGISHEKNLRKEQAPAAIPKLELLYREMVERESCRINLGKAARCVMEHDFSKGSVLWHCTEGKDRCGLLSAVLLSALGVERGTILEDYLLTNEVNGPKSDMYYQRILASGKTEAEAGMIRDVFLAKEEYLNEAFAAIDAQYRNTDAFLRDGLGIPQEVIENFQRRVLY
ncbi:MAG: tyrosine-protein phosphatase [Faecousia sp.]